MDIKTVFKKLLCLLCFTCAASQTPLEAMALKNSPTKLLTQKNWSAFIKSSAARPWELVKNSRIIDYCKKNPELVFLAAYAGFTGAIITLAIGISYRTEIINTLATYPLTRYIPKKLADWNMININSTDFSLRNPLGFAIEDGSLDTVTFLMEQCHASSKEPCDISTPPLEYAIKCFVQTKDQKTRANLKNIIDYLIQKNGGIKSKFITYSFAYKGKLLQTKDTLLNRAIEEGSLELVTHSVEKLHADVTNESLGIAINNYSNEFNKKDCDERFKIIEYLVKTGKIDVNKAVAAINTPLNCAIKERSLKLVKYFIETVHVTLKPLHHYDTIFDKQPMQEACEAFIRRPLYLPKLKTWIYLEDREMLEIIKYLTSVYKKENPDAEKDTISIAIKCFSRELVQALFDSFKITKKQFDILSTYFLEEALEVYTAQKEPEKRQQEMAIIKYLFGKCTSKHFTGKIYLSDIPSTDFTFDKAIKAYAATPATENKHRITLIKIMHYLIECGKAPYDKTLLTNAPQDIKNSLEIAQACIEYGNTNQNFESFTKKYLANDAYLSEALRHFFNFSIYQFAPKEPLYSWFDNQTNARSKNILHLVKDIFKQIEQRLQQFVISQKQLEKYLQDEEYVKNTLQEYSYWTVLFPEQTRFAQTLHQILITKKLNDISISFLRAN